MKVDKRETPSVKVRRGDIPAGGVWSHSLTGSCVFMMTSTGAYVCELGGHYKAEDPEDKVYYFPNAVLVTGSPGVV